MVTKRGTFI